MLERQQRTLAKAHLLGEQHELSREFRVIDEVALGGAHLHRQPVSEVRIEDRLTLGAFRSVHEQSHPTQPTHVELDKEGRGWQHHFEVHRGDEVRLVGIVLDSDHALVALDAVADHRRLVGDARHAHARRKMAAVAQHRREHHRPVASVGQIRQLDWKP